MQLTSATNSSVKVERKNPMDHFKGIMFEIYNFFGEIYDTVTGLFYSKTSKKEDSNDKNEANDWSLTMIMNKAEKKLQYGYDMLTDAFQVEIDKEMFKEALPQLSRKKFYKYIAKIKSFVQF